MRIPTHSLIFNTLYHLILFPSAFHKKLKGTLESLRKPNFFSHLSNRKRQIPPPHVQFYRQPG